LGGELGLIVIELPVPLWVLVRRVENRLLEELIVHVKFFS